MLLSALAFLTRHLLRAITTRVSPCRPPTAIRVQLKKVLSPNPNSSRSRSRKGRRRRRRKRRRKKQRQNNQTDRLIHSFIRITCRSPRPAMVTDTTYPSVLHQIQFFIIIGKAYCATAASILYNICHLNRQRVLPPSSWSSDNVTV